MVYRCDYFTVCIENLISVFKFKLDGQSYITLVLVKDDSIKHVEVPVASEKRDRIFREVSQALEDYKKQEKNNA